MSVWNVFKDRIAFRELRSLSKASAKVQQIFKLQNFFGSFFRRNFATFRHRAEFQIFDARKNFQHFGNIFGAKSGSGDFDGIRREATRCIFSKIDKKIHKTCYKKKIVLKIALTLHAIYKQKERDPRGYTE